MALKTTKWDVQDYLKTEEAIVAYLEAAAETGDHAHLTRALADAARARGMSELARQTGLSREGLYKALAPDGNPSFDTIARVAKAFNMSIGLVHAEISKVGKAKSEQRGNTRRLVHR